MYRWAGTVTLAPGWGPASVQIVSSVSAGITPVFDRYAVMDEAPVDVPSPTNHATDSGCPQVTVPTPALVASSASNPAAAAPLTETCVAPKVDGWGAGRS
jgi:hypothetical protein